MIKREKEIIKHIMSKNWLPEYQKRITHNKHVIFLAINQSNHTIKS